MQTLPLVQPPTNSFWPTQHAVSVINYQYGLAQQQTPLKLNMARCEIEAGQPEQARALFQEIIDDAPDTPYRPMIRFYLYQLTGKLIPEQPEAPAGQTEPEEVELPLVAPKP